MGLAAMKEWAFFALLQLSGVERQFSEPSMVKSSLPSRALAQLISATTTTTREVDRLGNDAADEAADFGRWRIGNLVIDARRNLSEVCGRWYPVILDLHRFFITISRAVVNHDGGDGTAPDPLALSKRRRLVHAVGDSAILPGPPGLWDVEWVTVPESAICAIDIAHWPYTPGPEDSHQHQGGTCRVLRTLLGRWQAHRG